VGGDAAATCEGGANVKNGSGGGNTTSGNGSVLGGNNVNAPVEAPVDVCGNAAAVLGEAYAGCEGKGEGGGGGGYRSSTAQRDTGSPVAVNLPVVSGIAEALPMNPAGALPVLPVQPPAGLPDGLSQVLAGLPVKLPSALHQVTGSAKHVVKQLPVKTPVAAPARAQAAPAPLPVLPEPVSGFLGGLPGGAVSKVTGALGGAMPALPKLPGALKLPGTPDVPGPLRQATPVPAPAALPVLPVVGDVVLPTVAQKVQTVQQTVSGEKIRPAAATEPISSGVKGGSLYVLAFGALLAGASAVTAIARRIRVGRR
jgi:hypothetical protein